MVGIWIRVSTDDQAQGESPEHHEERARWYCNSKGWEVTAVYHLEAISGKSVIEHPEARRMQKDIEEGKITSLVFSKLARLARSTKELLSFADFFRDHNADLISLQEAIDTSTPSGRLFYTVIAAMAQWEREEIASRVAASVPVRARLGKPLCGAAPFGYRWEGEKNKRLVLDELEAPVRKLMYEIFARTKRKKTTAKELNKLGYRTRKGGRFADSSIDRLLRDPMAKGIRRANYSKSHGPNKGWELKPSSEWVLTDCPAIVSEELWNDCNQYLIEQYQQRRKPGRQSLYQLAGFVECQCGKKMYVYHSNRLYSCKRCKNKISVDDIDEIFRIQLKSFLFTETGIGAYREEIENLLKEKTALLAVAKAKAKAKGIDEKMGQLVVMRVQKELSPDDFTRHYQPLKTQLLALEDNISRLYTEVQSLEVQVNSSETVISDARDLYTRWQQLPFEDKRTIIECITEQIIVDSKDITFRLAYLPTHISLPKGGKRQRTLKGFIYFSRSN